jgi:hypothetical protein
MSIKRTFDAVERRGDIGRRIAALVLPISNRPRVTSSCTGKIGLREPGEQPSGPNLASRDNVAHNHNLYTTLETSAPVHPALSKARPDIRYQMVTCCLACLEARSCRRRQVRLAMENDAGSGPPIPVCLREKHRSIGQIQPIEFHMLHEFLCDVRLGSAADTAICRRAPV